MLTMRSTLALAAMFTMAACVSPEEHRRALGANQALKAEIASLTAAQHAISLENERLRGELDRLGKQAADADWIREQKDKLDKLLSQYQSGGTGAVDGVELVRTSEGLAFRVLGGVLFAPGRIEISEQGKQTLGKPMATRMTRRSRTVGGAQTCASRPSAPWQSRTSWSRAASLPTRSASVATASTARLSRAAPKTHASRTAGSRF